MSGRKSEKAKSYDKKTIQGLLFDKPSKPINPTPAMGDLLVPAYDPVALNGTYSCFEYGFCNGHLYVLPTTPGSPSNFGFVTYDKSGFVFETLDRKSKKFITHVGRPVPPVDGVGTWNAFGYNNNRLVMLSGAIKQARTINLDAQGQPGAAAVTSQLDASAASGCSNSITKVAQFRERSDVMFKGIIPVPNRNDGAPTWAIAYSGKKKGLYGVTFSGEDGKWEDYLQESRLVEGAIGGVAAVIMVILAVFFWRRKRNQKKTKSDTQDALQPNEGNRPTSVDANGMAPTAGNSEVKGGSHLPRIEDTPLPPHPQEALSQSHQPQPQPAPHLDQMYHAYPQPQMYQNSMQQHQQPYPSTAAYTAPTTIPTLAPVPAPAVPASTTAPPAEALQQELQFSNHPRPNVATTIGGADP
ncbi:hypothetical protein BGW42_001100 [Actinomortierella wolfii]|nr:hypothetical protein BGW42_001100 [Actinomortierella wolfii]